MHNTKNSNKEKQKSIFVFLYLNFLRLNTDKCSLHCTTGAAREKKGKGGKKRKADDLTDGAIFEHQEGIRTWHAKCKLTSGPHWLPEIAKHSIPTPWLDRPMSRLGARENMLGHSTDIANDMLTSGVSECNITCLIFQEEVDAIGGIDAEVVRPA